MGNLKTAHVRVCVCAFHAVSQRWLDGLIWYFTASWSMFLEWCPSFQILKKIKINDFTAIFQLIFVCILDGTSFFRVGTHSWFGGFIWNFNRSWTIFYRWYVSFQILKKIKFNNFVVIFWMIYVWILDDTTVFRDGIQRSLGWFIWNFTALWTIFQICCLLF